MKRERRELQVNQELMARLVRLAQMEPMGHPAPKEIPAHKVRKVYRVQRACKV